MKLHNKLNKLEVRAIIERGQIRRLVTVDEADDSYDEIETELTDKQYADLGLNKNDLGCLDAHPEGSDRGGYVPTLDAGAYFMEHDGAWYGTQKRTGVH